MSLTHWEMLLYFSYWLLSSFGSKEMLIVFSYRLYPVSDPTEEEAGRWAQLTEKCYYISAIDYIQFLIQQKKKQEDELDSLRNVIIFQLLTISSFWSNRRRSRKMSSTHWDMLLYFSYRLYPVSDPTEEEAGRWARLIEKCYYISAIDYIQFLIQQKKKQEDELDSLRNVVIFQLLTISSFWSNRRRSRKMSSTHWEMLLYFSYWLYPVSDPTEEEAGRWARLTGKCYYISAIDFIQFLIQQKKKQEDELDSLRNVIIFQQ